MKVLILGGAGYIGSHVTRVFLDAGYQADVYDNFSTGCKENIFPQSKVFEADILDYPRLRGVIDSYQVVVHLAAAKAAGESMYNPARYAQQNIAGSINILQAASEADIKALVFSSSAAVYGEPQYTPIDEEHPTEPQNYYGFTKLEIERNLFWFDKLKGLRFASLRYFNAAGYDIQGRVHGLEKNATNLIPIIMEVATGLRSSMQIFGKDYPTPDGTCIRDYIHVSDLADAHLAAVQYLQNNEPSIVVNLGSETGFSVLEILDETQKVIGKKLKADLGPRRPGDSAKLIASSRLAEKVLNWKAQNSDLSTIISTSWAAYNKGNK